MLWDRDSVPLDCVEERWGEALLLGLRWAGSDSETMNLFIRTFLAKTECWLKLFLEGGAGAGECECECECEDSGVGFSDGAAMVSLAQTNE